MATKAKRKKWNIPPSYDVGVQFYYRNLLAGSDYVQAFVREHIAEADRLLTKHFDTLAAGKNIEQGERPQQGYFGLLEILRDAGVDERIVGHVNDHISHMAGGIGKNLDYFRAREFLAYCGIEGIYDLKANKHIKAAKKVTRIPETVVPEKWRAREDAEQVREDIAFLMDKSGRVAEIDKEISMLDKVVWGEFITLMTSDLVNNPPVGNIEPQRQQYLVDRPQLAESHAQLEALSALRVQTIEDLKDRHAPLDPAFKLPTLGIEFDKDWYDKGEAILGAQKPFHEKFKKQMAALGKKKGDPEYDAYDWQKLRIRTFALFDWAIRDFTMNKVNRGRIAEDRREDIPRRFVQAVKDEIKDGMLETLGFPYRLEPVAGKPDSYAIICNECVAETFTLESVLKLDKVLLAEDAANEAKKPKPQPVKSAPPVAKPPKPVKTAQEREIEIALRHKSTIDNLTLNGKFPTHLTLKDAQGNEVSATDAYAAAEKVLARAASAPPAAEPVPVAVQAVPAPEHLVDSPAAPVETVTQAVGQPEVAEPVVVEGTAPVDAEAAVVESPPVETAVTEPVAEAVATETSKTMPVIDEDDPFPGAGVPDDAQLSGNESKPKPEGETVSDAESADAPVIEFGDVTRDLGTGKSAEPLKTAEKDAKQSEPGKDRSSDGKSPAAETGAKKDYAARTGTQPQGQRGQQPQQQSGGGGYGAGAGAGYGAAGRGFAPQNLHIDLGIGPVIRGLQSIPGKIMKSLTPTGVDVYGATEKLSKSLADIGALKTAITAGVDAAGQPLTEAAKIAQWTALNQQLGEVNGQLKTLKKFPYSVMDESTPKTLRNASKELGAVADLAKANAENEGRLGELARDAKKVADHLVEGLMKIIKSIMNVFSRNKSPSLE